MIRRINRFRIDFIQPALCRLITSVKGGVKVADIKTRQINKGTIKTIDRAANLSSHVRSSTVRTKDQVDSQTEPEPGNESEYASDETIRTAGSVVNIGYRMSMAGKQKPRRVSAESTPRIDVKTKAEMVRKSRSVGRFGAKESRSGSMLREAHVGSRIKNAETSVIRGKRSIKPIVPIREGKSIKTISSTGGKQMTAQAKKTEAARKAVIKTRKMTERIRRDVKKSAIMTYKAMKAVIGGAKALFLALIAGGWVAVLVIVVFVFFGAAFYFFGDESSSNYTPVSQEVEAYTPVIQKYAEEYGIPEYVDLIKAVMMQESGGRGKDPMQAAEGPFNTKYPKKPNGIQDPDYSIQCGVQELKSVLEQAKVENPLDMEHIRLALQGYNYGNGYIAWAVKRDGGYTVENASAFSDEQAKKHGWKSYGDKQYVAHVLRYYPYGNYNYGIGNTKITQVAAQQIGNQGGKKFWSWYGFNNRVEWCACYVSWCADQCGYIKEGIIPKFSAVSDGISWFKDRNQWQKPGYRPMPGDIIFFDWEGDGSCDHVGIVEKCDENTVYTIEGNSRDECRRKTYSINSSLIFGYGVPKY